MTASGGHEARSGRRAEEAALNAPSETAAAGAGVVHDPAAGSTATGGGALRLQGRALVDGSASGPLMRLDEPLSFWGGLDPADGRIIDRRHPQCGQAVTGRVLLMPGGRGSSSSSTVLAEAIRLGTGPAAILLTTPDGIIALGALVAQALYGRPCPVVVVEPAGPQWRDGVQVAVDPSGLVHIRGPMSPN